MWMLMWNTCVLKSALTYTYAHRQSSEYLSFYVSISTYTHTCTRIHTYMRVCLCMCVYMYVHTHTYSHNCCLDKRTAMSVYAGGQRGTYTNLPRPHNTCGHRHRETEANINGSRFPLFHQQSPFFPPIPCDPAPTCFAVELWDQNFYSIILVKYEKGRDTYSNFDQMTLILSIFNINNVVTWHPNEQSIPHFFLKPKHLL